MFCVGLLTGLIFTFSIFAPLAHASVVSGSSSSRSLQSGLVGYWTFDGNDTNWNTYKINNKIGSNTGTLASKFSTTTSPRAGKIGQALYFNGTGSDEYITIASPIAYGNSVPWAYSVWLLWKGQSDIYVSPIGACIQGGLNVFLKNGSGNTFTYRDGAHAFHDFTSGSSASLIGKWTHLVIQSDGAGNLSLYKQGVLYQTLTGLARTDITFTCIGAGFSTANFFYKGLMDDVRIYNRALSSSEISKLYKLGSAKIASSAVSADNPNLNSGLVGWWTFDGKDTPWTSATAATTLDKSGNNNTGTLTNMNKATSVVQGKIGQGLKFDGVNDLVSLGTIGGGIPQITVSVWLKSIISTPTINLNLVNRYGDTTQRSFTFQRMTTGQYQFAVATGIGTSTANSNVNKKDTIWHHAVGVYDGANVTLYLDDVPGTPVPLTGTVNNPTGINVCLGSRGAACTSSTQYTAQILDDVRIYSRALSAAEISKLYKLGSAKIASSAVSADNPNLNSGLVGWWTFDGKDLKNNVADRSGQNNTGYLQNFTSTSSATVQGKIGQGLKFDGVDDRIQIGSPASLDISGPMTIMAWINTKTIAVGPNDIISNSNGAGAVQWAFEINRTAARLGYAHTGSGVMMVSSNTNLKANTWYHVAVVRTGSGSNWTATFYVNGVSDGAPSDVSTVNTNSNISLGAISGENNTIQFFDGTLDDVRIYNRALSASEVLKLYNLGR